MSRDIIPMGILAPKPKAPVLTPPSVEKLQMMLDNGMTDTVQLHIDTFKLPYKIDGTKIKDALEGAEQWISKFITEDPETLTMLEEVRLLSKIDDEVLITGETGTGKETIAKAMIGKRRGSIVGVNCAGLPAELIESELFGHVRGAFTGAVGEKKGLMSEAANGVMFLDEIGELPLHTQGKLLRALQEKKIRKVGGTQSEDITCKFVCATHRNIKEMVEEGKFRQDLYARISTFEIHIKPLRHRTCDIIPIIKSLNGGKEFIEKAADAIPLLDLSLNVRSLQRAVKRFNVLGRVIL